jgi:hypothetical protein
MQGAATKKTKPKKHIEGTRAERREHGKCAATKKKHIEGRAEI